MVQLEDGKTLYDALGLTKEASQAEVRKAYMKLALQLHPDKNPGDAGAEEKFKTLQKVYAVLGDEERRKVYDATGSLEDAEELAGDKFNELYSYYRSIYAKVTDADIAAFHRRHQGSAEERAELLRYYAQFKGDMGKVFEWVMCSDEAADSHRFMDILDAAIKGGKARSFAKYTAWAKRVAARPRPKAPKPGSRAGKKAAAGAEAVLVAQIRGRQAAALQPAGGVLGRLMAQYGGGGENVPAKPSEEEFQAAAQRLKQRSGGSGSGSGKKKAAAGGGGGKRTKK